MATNYPGSLDTSTQQPTIASSDEMDDSGKEHDVVHTNHSGAIIALETKLGTGDSNATANAVLMGTGSGTSAWDTSPTFKGAVTVGVDDTGHDVKFFGATSGKYMEWDESADQLNVVGSLNVTGNTQMTGTLTVGVDDTGHDVIFYGATTGTAWFWWDESANNLLLGPTSKLGLGTDATTPAASPLHVNNDNPVFTISDTADNYGEHDAQCTIHMAGRYYSGTANPLADAYSDVKLISFHDSTDGTGGAGLQIWTSATGGGGLTKKLEIDKAGSVLHVDGTVGAPAISFTSDPDTGMYRDGGDLCFSQDGQDAFRISGSRKFAFRDDAEANTISNRLVTMRSQTAGMTALLAWAEYDVSAANGTAGIFRLGDNGDTTNPDTGDYWLLFRRGNGYTVGSVRGTGSASVNFSTSSDQTMKNDLGDAGDVSSIIDAMKIHKFTWKDAKAHVGEQIGVFAQEVLEISGMPYGIATPAETRTEVVDTTTDEDGNEIDVEEDVYYPASIDYGKLVPLLVQEIKSLRQRVSTLEG